MTRSFRFALLACEGGRQKNARRRGRVSSPRCEGVTPARGHVFVLRKARAHSGTFASLRQPEQRADKIPGARHSASKYFVAAIHFGARRVARYMRLPLQHVAALSALMTTVLPPAGPWNQLANAWWVSRGRMVGRSWGPSPSMSPPIGQLGHCSNHLPTSFPTLPHSFFLSALVSDLLVLRCLLFMAYIFLLSGAITGYPSWPNWGWQGRNMWGNCLPGARWPSGVRTWP